jgi:hypothetical protein
VRGSLDKPPIVVTTSYWKTFAYFAGNSVFVLIGILMISTEDAAWVDWVVGFFAAFFGVGALAMIAQMVAPPSLTLTPEGVSWSTGFKTVHHGWRDIHEFRVYRIPGTSTTMVGFDYRPDYPEYLKLRKFNKRLMNVEGALGMSWSISNAALADLLNDARARWFVD